LVGLKAAAQTLELLHLSETNMRSLEGISSATSLKELHVTGNGIDGTFPDELFALSHSIEVLHLAENNFFGSFPTKIGEMTNLHSIFAYQNDFLSTIPSELGKLKYLKHLGKWNWRRIISGCLRVSIVMVFRDEQFLQRTCSMDLFRASSRQCHHWRFWPFFAKINQDLDCRDRCRHWIMFLN
jgi:hypothetical protein